MPAPYANAASRTVISVADNAALRAVFSNLLGYGSKAKSEDKKRYWVFDAASLSADDDAQVLLPDDLTVFDPGRWVIDSAGYSRIGLGAYPATIGAVGLDEQTGIYVNASFNYQVFLEDLAMTYGDLRKVTALQGQNLTYTADDSNHTFVIGGTTHLTIESATIIANVNAGGAYLFNVDGSLHHELSSSQVAFNPTAAINLQVGSVTKMQIEAASITTSAELALGHAAVTFGASVVSPVIKQADDATVGGTGDLLSIHGQSMTGGGSSTGGGVEVCTGSGNANGTFKVLLGHPGGLLRLNIFADGIDFGDDSSVDIMNLSSGNEVRINSGGSARFIVDSVGLAFFGNAPVARPTGVAVSDAAIHAALTSLGLITA